MTWRRPEEDFIEVVVRFVWIQGEVPDPAFDEVLEHWAKKHGLDDLAPEKVAPFGARALEDLSASRIPESALNRANQLLKAGTEAMGWAGEPMMHNRVGCEELGTCLIGCPADAKRNTRFVAIPAALSHGARVFVRARVERIADGSAEHRQFWHEMELARVAYRANRTMNFFVDPSQGHDDYLMSLALAVEAASDARPRPARGRIGSEWS